MLNPYIYLMSAGHLVVDLGQGILPIIMPLLTEKLGLSFFQVGLVALTFTFSSAIIQPVFGVLSDRFSMPWLMPLGLFLSGFGLALTGIINSYYLLLGAVLLSGIGVAGYHPEGSKLTHLVSKEGRAGTSMSLFSVGGNLGFGIGPMLAMFFLSFSGLKSIVGVVIPGLVAAIVFLFFMPKFSKILKEGSSKEKTVEVNEVKEDNKKQSKKTSLKLLVLYVVVRSWVHAGLIYFIPFYFPAFRGITEPEYLVSIFLIAGALGTIIGGPFADRFGGRNGLVLSMIISLLGIFPFLYLEGKAISVFAFIVGAALISTFSITVVYGQKLLPNNIGLASGLVMGFGVGAGSIGVTMLGYLADIFGLPIAMNIISLLPILGLVIAFALPNDKPKQSSVEVEEISEQKA
ncbi:MAG: MFS transporter [Clostridiales bacterium]|nr:MFS transporter [Clostridiales bacterium]